LTASGADRIPFLIHGRTDHGPTTQTPRHGRRIRRSLHPSCAVLHYNMACYECLLGDIPEARRRLSVACKMGKEWKTGALTDPDLKTMWDA
jgi:hypothetical protein